MHLCELYLGWLYSNPMDYTELLWHSNRAISIRVNSITCLEPHAIFSGCHPMFAKSWQIVWTILNDMCNVHFMMMLHVITVKSEGARG